jgi:hypothetical protein
VTEDPRSEPALPPPPRSPPPAAPPVFAPVSGSTGSPRAGRSAGSSRGWRTSLAVLGTILVVVAGVNMADASVPLPEAITPIDDPAVPDASFPVDPDAPAETLTPIEPGPVEQGDTIEAGLGYTIRAPAGWTVVSQEDETTVLQKGAAMLVIAAIATEDSPEDLATWYRDAWFQGGGYTGGDSRSRTVGNGIPAAEVDYTGAFDGSTIDGRIVTVSDAGAGLLINALAPTGSLAEIAPDIDAILTSVALGA